jgi:AraC family transcriptional regulator
MASSAESTWKQPAALPPLPRQIAEHPPGLPQPNFESRSLVSISPPEIAKRHSATWSGFRGETVQIMRHTQFEYGFRAPWHLLIAAEVAERYDGESFVEGLPRSTLRDFTHKLTFVPAGHDFRGWQRPRALTHTTYFYIDPHGPLADPALRFEEIEFKPRLFFYDRDLWQTALKLKSVIENADTAHRQYAEALGIVLTHELVRINGGSEPHEPVSRGGLAAWQQKRVAAYVEGACRRRYSARDAGRTGAAQCISFLPLVQTFFRPAATPISRDPANRTGQAAIGESRTVGHGDCT